MMAVMIAGGLIATAPAALAGQPASYQRAETALAQGKLLDARLDLLNAVHQHPHDGAAHALLGHVLFQLGDPVSAEREARKALAAHFEPNRSLALVLRCYIAQGRSVALLHDFPIGTATGARAAVIAVGRARANLVLSRFDRAKADLQQAATFMPDAPAVYYAQIDLAFATHDLAQVKAGLAQAATHAPGAPRLLRRQAQLDLTTGKPADAVALLQQAKQKDPGDIKTMLLLVQALSAAGQIPAAQAQLTQVLKFVPKSVGAAYLQATIDVDSHHWHHAHVMLQRIGGAAKQVPGILYLQAETDEALGQPATALTAAQSFAAQTPENAGAQLLVALLAVQTGHYALAQTALDHAAKTGPLNAQGFDLRASVDFHEQHWAQARQDVDQALKLDPHDVAAWRRLGLLDMRRGAFAKAQQDFQTTARLVPPHATAMAVDAEHHLAVAALFANDIPAATKAIARLNTLGGPTAAAPLQAQLAILHGDLSAARVAFDRLLKADPKSVQAQLGLARIELLQQNQSAALDRLTKLAALHPAQPRIIVALVGLQRAMGQQEAALATLERAHRHAPDDAQFVAAILQQQRAAKQFKAASGLLATISPTVRAQPAVLVQRAMLAVAQGHLDSAALSLQAVLAANPDDIASRLALAHIDVARKHPRAAVAVVEAGLQRDPHQLALLEARVGLALSEHGPSGAQHQIAQLRADPSHQPQAALLEGLFDEQQHQWAASVTAFTKAYAKTPSPLLAMNAIRADIQVGQHPAALAMLKSAVGKFPNDVALSDMNGSLALDQGHLTAAAQAYRHSLQLAPQDTAALDNLAWIAGKQGKDDALSLAQRAYFGSPLPQTADTLGWILLRQDHGKAPPAQALTLLNAAHAGDPADPSIAYHDAVALAQSGATAQAVTILEQIVGPKAPAASHRFADQPKAEALLTKLQHPG
jgi:putative PEP-CTERM system TPR-repeat lipoprotein